MLRARALATNFRNRRLGSSFLSAYGGAMTGIIRFLGILNAAIWLGGSVFFSLAAAAVPFSSEMQILLGPANYPYFSGVIAQIGIARFFTFQIVCCVIALAQLAAEWLYQQRAGRKFLLSLLVAILGLTLLGAYGLQPKMKQLHRAKYAVNYSPAQRAAAAQSFKAWHATSQVLNLFVLGGLVSYLFQMSRPTAAPRFVRPPQLRGPQLRG